MADETDTQEAQAPEGYNATALKNAEERVKQALEELQKAETNLEIADKELYAAEQAFEDCMAKQ